MKTALKKVSDTINEMQDTITEQRELNVTLKDELFSTIKRLTNQETVIKTLKSKTADITNVSTKTLLEELLKREVGNKEITAKDITDAKIKKRHPVSPSRTVENVDPYSVMRYLPTIGLRPMKTTDFLVTQGFLKLVKKEYTRVTSVKIPTTLGSKLFETRHNNGLYLTTHGRFVFDSWLKNNIIPKECFIKE